MSIQHDEPPPTPERELVLGRAPGPVLHVLDRGAAVRALHVAGADGVRRNVVLGHQHVRDYGQDRHYLGSCIGRYANRIRSGRFLLDGVVHHLPTNDRGHHLHGGPEGFHRRTWTVTHVDERSAVLRLVSPDGDEGYPGRLDAKVRYEVDSDAVRITFSARTNAPTVVNLTSHAYFCLAGEGRGSVDDHLLQVHAQQYLPTDATGIPRPVAESVADTPFDLRAPVRVGEVVRTPHSQLRDASGVDHNLVLDGTGLRRVAELYAPGTGIGLQLWTDQPGLQVYTGNHLDGTVVGTSGGTYRQGDGIALEPQTFPDSPNHPQFPSPVLRPGEEYRCAIEWRFTAAGRPT